MAEQPAQRPSLIESVLAGTGSIMNGGGEPPKQEPTASQILTRLMFQRGENLTMLTRLTPEQIKAIWLALCASRHVGYTPLENAATLLMELYVSQDGKGRLEGTGMAHIPSPPVMQPQGPPMKDPALDFR